MSPQQLAEWERLTKRSGQAALDAVDHLEGLKGVRTLFGTKGDQMTSGLLEQISQSNFTAEQIAILRQNLDDYPWLLEKLNGKPEQVRAWTVTGATKLVNHLTNTLVARGVSSSVADDIVLRAMYIDDVIGNNKMISLLDEIVGSSKFKNPEDLLENLNSSFRSPVSSGSVNSQSANNLLKELEEGKYWMNQGHEVYISKKWSGNADEVDVTITTKNALVECKNVTGGVDAVRDRLNDIIKKFTDESKLSSSIKNQYPDHYGKLNINNSSNSYYNLNKQQFMNKIKTDLFDQAGGINKNNLTNSISELHIENAQGRFVIKNTEWQ